MEQQHRRPISTDGFIGPVRNRQPASPARPAGSHQPQPPRRIDDMVSRPAAPKPSRPDANFLDLTPRRPDGVAQTIVPKTAPAEPLAHLRPRPFTPVRSPQPVTQAPEEPAPVPKEDSSPPVPVEKQPKQKRKINNVWQYVLIVIAASAVGVVLPNIQYGQWAIAAYAVFALIFRVKSQVTFALALFALVTVPLLILFGQKELAENYAVYSFLLLVVGVISATIELRFSKPDTTHTSVSPGK